MDLTYITLEEAAVYEGMKYRGMASRVNRNPDEYDLKLSREKAEGVRKSLSQLPPCLPRPAGPTKLLRQLIRKRLRPAGKKRRPGMWKQI